MTQESVLLRFQLRQAAPQPVQARAQVAQVLRPADADRLREVGAAQPADGGVELGDRPRDDAREREDDRQRGGERSENQLQQPAAKVTSLRASSKGLPFSWVTRRARSSHRAVMS